MPYLLKLFVSGMEGGLVFKASLCSPECPWMQDPLASTSGARVKGMTFQPGWTNFVMAWCSSSFGFDDVGCMGFRTVCSLGYLMLSHALTLALPTLTQLLHLLTESWFFFFIFYILFYYVYVCITCTYACEPWVFSVLRSQKTTLDPLGLEVQMVMSHCMGASSTMDCDLEVENEINHFFPKLLFDHGAYHSNRKQTWTPC